MKVLIKYNDNNNQKELDVTPNITLDLFYGLIVQYDTASHPYDSVWIIRSNGHLQVLIYFQKTNKFIFPNSLPESTLEEICEKEGSISFTLEVYDSPKEYGKKLFIAYGGDTNSLFRDGWHGVYQLCNIKKDLEDKWRQEIRGK